jgi:hypothetical protein
MGKKADLPGSGKSISLMPKVRRALLQEGVSMSETLGSLCDKLTIIALKQFHSDNPKRLKSLNIQEKQLQQEIDEFIVLATNGIIPIERLTFSANKIYKQEGNDVAEVTGDIGEVFSRLSEINCLLWHEQEKVYEFEQVAPAEKNTVVKHLALLNLERNKCIDRIDRQFRRSIEHIHSNKLKVIKSCT